MSVQFGRWNLDGQPVDRDFLEKVKPILAPYGPDDAGVYSKGNISILYRAFHTTKESRREMQPHVTNSGAILTWDGRLDNRAELIRRMRDVVTIDSTDASIVAAAYDCWGNDCFSTVIGDWALSIWDPHTRSLFLAKDPIGARHLYYSFDHNQVTWSTILDPLILCAENAFTLCEEYIAGWYSFFPPTDLTPYQGVHSVPPSCYVLLQTGKRSIAKYWEFDPSRRIRYSTDAEYEEHFRGVFAEAVRRRLRSSYPVLAELSGGIDSSAIVCIADKLFAEGRTDQPRLDTLSYYHDDEPNWNERPYFTMVERQRGRVGCHIDVASQEFFKLDLQIDSFAPTPLSSSGPPSKTQDKFIECVSSHGNRVVLSGLGGDEVTGGVPTPTLEIADLISRAHFEALTHQLKLWALSKRKPWLYILGEATRRFLPATLAGVRKYRKPPPWLRPDFVKRHQASLLGHEIRLKMFGALPSFQDNLQTLEGLRRQLECSAFSSQPLHEKRYPFLDRNLLEFVNAIPREQLVRPGQRRSLMRRALCGVVPDAVLNRRRKAFVARAPMVAISTAWTTLLEMTEHMVSSSIGIVDPKQFLQALHQARNGREVPIVPLIRTLIIEYWLRNVTCHEKISIVPENYSSTRREFHPSLRKNSTS